MALSRQECLSYIKPAPAKKGFLCGPLRILRVLCVIGV
jgi:hypothetical protein